MDWSAVIHCRSGGAEILAKGSDRSYERLAGIVEGINLFLDLEPQTNKTLLADIARLVRDARPREAVRHYLQETGKSRVRAREIVRSLGG